MGRGQESFAVTGSVDEWWELRGVWGPQGRSGRPLLYCFPESHEKSVRPQKGSDSTFCSRNEVIRGVGFSS